MSYKNNNEVFSISTVKKSRDEYIKRLNGIYFKNLEKVTVMLTD